MDSGDESLMSLESVFPIRKNHLEEKTQTNARAFVAIQCWSLTPPPIQKFAGFGNSWTFLRG